LKEVKLILGFKTYAQLQSFNARLAASERRQHDEQLGSVSGGGGGEASGESWESLFSKSQKEEKDGDLL